VAGDERRKAESGSAAGGERKEAESGPVAGDEREKQAAVGRDRAKVRRWRPRRRKAAGGTANAGAGTAAPATASAAGGMEHMGALGSLPQVAPGVVRFDREFRAAGEHCGAVLGSSSVELLRFKGTMGATAAEFMLDSGASTNFVDQALVKRMGWQTEATTKRVKLPDGRIVPAAGAVTAWR
jgi:hypothetical protein